MSKQKNITMQEVKKLTGLTSRQIRYYDQQDLIFPGRTKGNQRLFSLSDIEKLLKIKELLTAGNNVETIKLKLQRAENSKDREYLSNYSDYSDVELDSLFPVSNRSELVKKLSQSRKKD